MGLSYEAIRWLLDLLMTKTAQQIQPLVLPPNLHGNDSMQLPRPDDSIRQGTNGPFTGPQLTLRAADPRQSSINNLFNPQWPYSPGKTSTPDGSWNRFGRAESAGATLFGPRYEFESLLRLPPAGPLRVQPLASEPFASNRPPHELLNISGHGGDWTIPAREPQNSLVLYLNRRYDDAVMDESLSHVDLFRFKDFPRAMEEYLKLLTGQDNMFYRMNLRTAERGSLDASNILVALFSRRPLDPSNSPIALFDGLNRTIDQYRYVQGHPRHGSASRFISRVNEKLKAIPTPLDAGSYAFFGEVPEYTLGAMAAYGTPGRDRPEHYTSAIVPLIWQPITWPPLHESFHIGTMSAYAGAGLLALQLLSWIPHPSAGAVRGVAANARHALRLLQHGAHRLGRVSGYVASNIVWPIILPDIFKDTTTGVISAWKTLVDDPDYRVLTLNNTLTHFACRTPIIGPDGRMSTFWDASYDIPHMMRNPLMRSFFSTKVAAGALGVWPDDPQYNDVLSEASDRIPERVHKVRHEMSPTYRISAESMTVLTLTTPLLFPNTDFAPVTHIYADRVEEREVLHGIIEKYKDQYAKMQPNDPAYDARVKRGASLLASNWEKLQEPDLRVANQFVGDMQVAASGRGLKYHVLPKLMMARYPGSEILADIFRPGQTSTPIENEIRSLTLSEAELAKYTFRLLSYMNVASDERGRIWFSFDAEALKTDADRATFFNDAAKFSVLLEWYLNRGINQLQAEQLQNPHLEMVRKADDIAQRLIRDLGGSLSEATEQGASTLQALRNPTIRHLVYSRIFNAEWVATQLALSPSENDRKQIFNNVYRYSPFIAVQARQLQLDKEWQRQQYRATGNAQILDESLRDQVDQLEEPFYFAYAAATKDAQVTAAFTPMDMSLGALAKQMAYRWVPQPKWMVACFQARDAIAAAPLFHRYTLLLYPVAAFARGYVDRTGKAYKEHAIAAADEELARGSDFAQLLNAGPARTGEVVLLLRELLPKK